MDIDVFYRLGGERRKEKGERRKEKGSRGLVAGLPHDESVQQLGIFD